MEFNNSGMGKCVVLKENDTSYSLVYAITGKQFIIVSDFDKHILCFHNKNKLHH